MYVCMYVCMYIGIHIGQVQLSAGLVGANCCIYSSYSLFILVIVFVLSIDGFQWSALTIQLGGVL